jgi:hypothetical protein
MARAIDRLKESGVLLHVSLCEDGNSYFTTPDNRPFPANTARSLIAKGEVQPIPDGLFEGQSQSYRYEKIQPGN